MMIRRAVPEDGPAVAEVQVRAWRAAYRGLVPQDYLDAMDTVRRGARWTDRIDGAAWPSAGMLVAEGDGGVAAFACFAPAEEGGGQAGRGAGEPLELEAFYSLPEVWGSGVNQRLITGVHEALAAAGCAEAVLWVLRDNPRARRFYAAHGWEADGTVTEEGPINGVVLPRVRYRRKF
ncbi:GNAT superfamily N-acetyltransferase [Nocardiopsis arvandica]|uniref:GNAT superfamily N-acetyltransferase n=1 Tax=Nocardiopsis sinuspersici TaxID=501010 RepID=A0A7Z0BK26_9ACTN|nr:GNAT family N-acetyltransferase [Nocardiopsis sinuspersici]NYH54363.1 GNAT superfamily N-acetyltransferase [Nocardiopsis sinuspersici]